jgi:hypothetical protein
VTLASTPRQSHAFYQNLTTKFQGHIFQPKSPNLFFETILRTLHSRKNLQKGIRGVDSALGRTQSTLLPARTPRSSNFKLPHQYSANEKLLATVNKGRTGAHARLQEVVFGCRLAFSSFCPFNISHSERRLPRVARISI